MHFQAALFWLASLPFLAVASPTAEQQATTQQQPLRLRPQTLPTPSSFTKVPQDGTACASHGESNWAGVITVDKGHDMFYWFFDSRNEPETDPIIIYIAGGPGASSISVAITGLGPCALNSSDDIVAGINPWSWNNNASLLFIDQPVGTGFSELAHGLPLPKSEQETAPDFEKFLQIFFQQAFPDKQDLPIHLATASYGGHYGPVYLQHMMESRQRDPDGLAFIDNIKSLILMDSTVDFTAQAVGAYEMVCRHREEVGLLNQTACDSMAKHMPEQLRLGRRCLEVYHGEECRVSYDYGQKYIHAPMNELVAQYKINLGNINEGCIPSNEWPYCLPPRYVDVTKYFNQAQVKQAFGFPTSFKYTSVNQGMHLNFRNYGSPWNPTSKELERVLSAYNDEPDLLDIKVLVMNGNSDYVVNAAGNMWLYDRLNWTDKDDYTGNEWRPVEAEANLAFTGIWKGVQNGRLAFVAVDNAGHFISSDSKEGTFHIIQKWLADDWRMQRVLI